MMSQEQFIDEPVTTQARFLPDGRVRPTAFVWRGQTRYVTGLGRRWTEEEQGTHWQCFLAQTASGDTVELRWNMDSQQWRLRRAWWRSVMT
ncbi:MAG: hypothetical protein U9R25_14340 [Chloroflexota bacterium]|nr:hypothetical protein [Chloroflexota bacterium]